ncbi:restriction endonuclease subunit S [bacterium]|nr:restriction endonuclease subunit S [bacterium]
MSDSLPTNWKWKPLDELAEIDREQLSVITPSAQEFFYIDISSAFEGKLRLPSNKIPYGEAPSRARKVLKRGDVLMSTVRPNLRAFAQFDHSDDLTVASTGFAVLTAKQGVDDRFILYSILSDNIAKQVEGHVVGSNYPAINTKDVRRLLIPTPPPGQQRKIAEILTTVDNLIERTEALIAKQESIKQGMMHDLFTRGVDEHGQLRPPYEQAPDLYKPSELGMIPKEWDTSLLEELTEKIIDGTHFTPEYREHGVPFLRVTDIQDTSIDFSKLKYISPEEHRILTLRCNPMRGDILLSKNGTIGLLKIVDWDWEFSIFVSLALIRPIVSKINTRFLTYYLQSDQTWAQIRKRSKQGTVTNLHLEEIRELVVAVFPAKEQERVADVFQTMNRTIDTYRSDLEKLQHLKTGLMQDLLTGKVRVNVDEAMDALDE